MTMRIRKEKRAVRRVGNSGGAPAIMRALVKRYATFSDLTPVDTLNTPQIDYNKLNDLSDPTHKKTVQWQYKDEDKKSGARAYSYVLRSAYAALKHAKRKGPELVINHITVNLDHVQSEATKVGNAKHAGAAFYGDKIKNRFKNGLPKQGIALREAPQFILSMEDSKDGSNHVHIVIVYHKDDRGALNAMLRIEAKSDDNAVMFQNTYKQYLDVPQADPYPDLSTGETKSYLQRLSEVNELNRIDRKYDKIYRRRGEDREPLCVYPHWVKKGGQLVFYRHAPIDAGIVDYISKELDKKVQGFPRATRLFMDGETKREAAKIYKSRHEQGVDYKDNQVIEPEAPAAAQQAPEPSPSEWELAQFKGCDLEREAFRVILEVQGLL